MKYLVVYTALFGDYDSLPEPKGNLKNCKFVCFTDQNFESDVWEIFYVTELGFSPSLMNRYYKFMPHKFLADYKYSLYLDSNLIVNQCPLHLISDLKDESIALPDHKSRGCIYDEITACYAANKISFRDAINHYKFLKKENFPTNMGLTENNMILREHNHPNAVHWGESIWDGLQCLVARDQLLSQYFLWKNNIPISTLSENSWQLGESVKFIPHKYFQNLSFLHKALRKLKFYFKSMFFNAYRYL